MNVKLIAVDMDGTFLTNNNEYDQERFTRQYEFMKEKGIHFVVASGNQYYQLRSFFPDIHNELKEKIGHIMTPVDCGHFGIDLIIPGINKAHGINLLMERWKISDAETMAFGDSGNDLEMLEQATYGFAMANAKEAIKKIADYTISSNEEHGVLEVVDWYISKKKMFE